MAVIPGKYILIQSDNYDAFLSACGVNFLLRRVAMSVTPTFEMRQLEDSKWFREIKAGLRAHNSTFKSGEEFPEVTMDGRSVISKWTLEGEDTFVGTETWEDNQVEGILKFSATGMVATLKLGDVCAVRTYKRL